MKEIAFAVLFTAMSVISAQTPTTERERALSRLILQRNIRYPVIQEPESSEKIIGRYQLLRITLPVSVIDDGDIGEDTSHFRDDTLTIIFDTATGNAYEISYKFNEYIQNDSVIYEIIFLKDRIKFNQPFRIGRPLKE